MSLFIVQPFFGKWTGDILFLICLILKKLWDPVHSPPTQRWVHSMLATRLSILGNHLLHRNTPMWKEIGRGLSDYNAL